MTNNDSGIITLPVKKSRIEKFVFEKICHAKRELEKLLEKSDVSFATSRNKFSGVMHLATFVLYDKKNNIFSVVQDPRLRYLYYGNLRRLNDGVISNGFEQFFPYYEDFIYGTEPEDVLEEKTIVKNAFENNSFVFDYGLDVVNFDKDIVIVKNVPEEVNIYDEYFSSFLRAVLYDSDENYTIPGFDFDNSFFSILKRSGYFVIVSRSNERFFFKPYRKGSVEKLVNG